MRLASGNELSSVTLTSRTFALQIDAGRRCPVRAAGCCLVHQAAPLSTTSSSYAVRRRSGLCGCWCQGRCPTCGFVRARELPSSRRRCARRCPGAQGKPTTTPPANAPASTLVWRCFACMYQFPMPITIRPARGTPARAVRTGRRPGRARSLRHACSASRARGNSTGARFRDPVASVPARAHRRPRSRVDRAELEDRHELEGRRQLHVDRRAESPVARVRVASFRVADRHSRCCADPARSPGTAACVSAQVRVGVLVQYVDVVQLFRRRWRHSPASCSRRPSARPGSRCAACRASS